MTTINQTSPPIYLGVTPPISIASPKSEDFKLTKDLEKVLQTLKIYENQQESTQRLKILARLNFLFRQWIKKVSMDNLMPEIMAEQLGGKILPFGSFKLGVHQAKADIDALCIAPRNIDRKEFFSSFFEVLKSQPEVTECRAIEEAFVPVIKMKFEEMEIDLIYARLALKEIPNDLDLSDSNLLKNLDPRCIRSLNGCRVADEILKLVPNVENFRLTLRIIKVFAKKHGIYSNSLGYLGGISWAILVARACQLYPNAIPATLVHKFFLIFSCWQWPQPVILKHPEISHLNFPTWDPRHNPQDRFHLMPVITPAYPQQNSTFNVTNSTAKVIRNKLQEGLEIMNEIVIGKANWNQLFNPTSFFTKYRHFVVLLVKSNSVDDHLEWCGLIESKIRILIGNLEKNQQVKMAHINPRCFQEKNDIKECSSKWFIGLEFVKSQNLSVDLTQDILNFTDFVKIQALKLNILQEGMNIEVRHVRRKQLSDYINSSHIRSERKSSESQKTLESFITQLSKRKLSDESKNLNCKKRKLM